ncbi:MAG: hydrolase Nlp/P60 [Chitinophagaceae bacterium]|nr:MAG: hydrolase Nlp/P60 [Chitinophagaceae bacterium]
MLYGICDLSVIPLRSQASDKSEMTTQLLFGETVQILNEDMGWYNVICDYDKYTGYVDKKQITILNEKTYKKIIEQPLSVALDLVQSAFASNAHIPVLAGSLFPNFDGMSFKIGKEKYIYNGQVISFESIEKPDRFIEKCALRYLYAPYLWGGKSPFGIDCSGFTQMVYRMLGIKIQRDAYQQAVEGTEVAFPELASTGDLAFFSKEKEKNITHVGIILDNERIIHACGRVRIDKFDHFGIFNEELKQYSHKLKLIRRFF